MLRIERDTPRNGIEALRLEGQLAGAWVEELRAACLSAIHRGATPQLDLEGVTFIDLEGLALLRDLWAHVVVTRSSLFAAEQLKTLPERNGKESQ